MSRRVLPAVALIVLVLAAPAAAQDDGVTIDPSAPTAKEYAIPLEQARRDAAGTSDAPVTPGKRSAPLFGEGVTEDATPRERTTTTQATDPADEPDEPTVTTTAGGVPPTAAVDSSDATLALLGGGAGALLLVGGLAYAVRRRG